MQKDYNSSKGGYVRFERGKIQYSSLEYLLGSLENNMQMSLIVPDALGEVILPFCSALLVKEDPWAMHYLHSDAHRKLMESEKFSDSIRPLCMWYIKKCLERSKEKIILDDLNLYVPVYEKLFDVHAPIEYEAVKRVLKPKKNETVLEIGFATGNLSHLLAKDVKEVTGIDKHKSYVKYAMRKAKKLGLENCRFVHADYPCKIKDFDYAVAFNVTFSSEKFRNHVFPSDEALIGVTVNRATNEGIKNMDEEIRKAVANFKNNYDVQIRQENPEELGKFMNLVLIHMNKK